MKVFSRYLMLGFLFTLLTAGCAQQEMQTETDSDMQQNADKVAKAVAQIHAADGNEILGTVLFTEGSEGINVVANISGLETGEHGFHIHEFGDCTAEDLTSAGGHYNPFDVQHGAPTDSVRHVGDMGNLSVNQEGVGERDYVDQEITLNGTGNIIGRSVVIHAGTDDFTSQPSGAAGNRLACGVIGIANSANM